jgi:hypothetical protein
MDKKILEFGQAVSVMPGALPDDVAKEMLLKMANQTQHVLSHIKDIEFIGDIQILDGPSVDMLGRFGSKGYYFQAASDGYDILRAHFKCREEHVPRVLTKEYIFELMERYVRDNMSEDKEEEY